MRPISQRDMDRVMADSKQKTSVLYSTSEVGTFTSNETLISINHMLSSCSYQVEVYRPSLIPSTASFPSLYEVLKRKQGSYGAGRWMLGGVP